MAGSPLFLQLNEHNRSHKGTKCRHLMIYESDMLGLLMCRSLCIGFKSSVRAFLAMSQLIKILSTLQQDPKMHADTINNTFSLSNPQQMAHTVVPGENNNILKILIMLSLFIRV